MIELFSGVGAQERALRQFGFPYEVTNTCDCDKDAVLSYAAMRWDLEKEMETFEFPSQDKMIEELQAKNLGYDFQKGKHTITKKTSLPKLKQYYIADKLSKNLGDISLVEKLPYADLATYSFPCTDLSVAGKGEGMVNKCDFCGYSWPIDFSDAEETLICPECGEEVSSSTRSGLLGQVQRLLGVAKEDNTLPKYLLLENVKNLIGKKFIGQFEAWVKWLDNIGYNTYWKVLNGKHYGIPQNRERVFAISIRKDVDVKGFIFPETVPLTTRLKDMLEHCVDEKYYLPDDRIEKIINSTFMQEKKRIQMTDICDTLLARDWKDPKCVPVEDDISPIRIGNIYDENYGTGYAGNVWDKDGVSPTLQTAQGGNRMPLVLEEEPFIVASRGRNPDNPSDRTVGAPTEQRLEPNFSGCTNTLTSVQKDNYVAEPIVCEERRDEGIRLFKDDCVGTLRTIDACGDKRVLEPQLEFVGGLGNKDWAKDGKQLSRNYPQGSRVYSADGIASSLTAQGVGGAGGFSGLYAVEDRIRWRIRKLTPKECIRLMNFTDSDYEAMAKYVSNSAIYKQAGNSIIVACLIAIMSSLFIEDGHKAEVWTKYILNYKD